MRFGNAASPACFLEFIELFRLQPFLCGRRSVLALVPGLNGCLAFLRISRIFGIKFDRFGVFRDRRVNCCRSSA